MLKSQGILDESGKNVIHKLKFNQLRKLNIPEFFLLILFQNSPFWVVYKPIHVSVLSVELFEFVWTKEGKCS